MPAGAPAPAVLLYIPNVEMEIEELYFDGGLNLDTTGIVVTGPESSRGRIKKSTFTGVEVGVEAVDSGIRITRNLFTGILRDAIYVHAPDGATGPVELPEIGSTDALEVSGFNQFRDVGGFVGDDDDGDDGKGINLNNAFVLRNTTGQTLVAQLNDWDVFNSGEILARLSTADPDAKSLVGTESQKQAAVPFIVEPFLGKSAFPGSIYLRIKDQGNNLPLSVATPALLQSGIDLGITPDFDPLSDLYSFTFLTPGIYQANATAPDYTPQGLEIVVAPGAIEAREIFLTSQFPPAAPG